MEFLFSYQYSSNSNGGGNMLKAPIGQTGKARSMTKVVAKKAPDFKQQIKDSISGIRTRQLDDRALLIQEKGDFAYVFAKNSEHFLAGMVLLRDEGYRNVAFGAHEAGGIFSATLIKAEHAAGTSAR